MRRHLGKLLEVQLVALVVVRGHGLGVVVNHRGSVAHLAQGSDRAHAAPGEEGKEKEKEKGKGNER